MSPPIVAITIGDPAGIGPEITIKSLKKISVNKACRPIIIGSRDILLSHNYKIDNFDFIDIPCEDIKKIKVGKYSAASGLMAYKYIVQAVDLAKAGKVKAIVTAPVSKAAFAQAGIKFEGHTELLADLTKSKKIAMLMASDKYRSLMITRHLAMRNIAGELSMENIIEPVLLVNDFIKVKYKIKKPKIAVCSLNPHAGENSMLGSEEEDIILPAVRILKDRHINVDGPLPSDSAWLKMKNGLYDLLVTMYHDQTMIGLKCLNANKIVNITVGLPFIRTSPGHGTAFDIAGCGIADPSSMIEAIKTASLLSKKGGKR